LNAFALRARLGRQAWDNLVIRAHSLKQKGTPPILNSQSTLALEPAE